MTSDEFAKLAREELKKRKTNTTSSESNQSKSRLEDFKKRREKEKLELNINLSTLANDIDSLNTDLNNVSDNWHTSDEINSYKERTNNLLNRVKNYKNYVQKYGNATDNDLSNIDSLISGYDNNLSFLNDRGNLYSNYKNAEEYNTAKKQSEWIKKWSGKSYDEITKAISDTNNNLGGKDSLKSDELAWLENYAPTIKYDNYTVEELKQMRDSAKKDMDEGKEGIIQKAANLLFLGDPNAYNRHNIDRYNELNEAYNSKYYDSIGSNDDFEEKSSYNGDTNRKFSFNKNDVEDNLYYLSLSQDERYKLKGETGNLENLVADYMTEDEVKKLNYLYNTSGYPAANEYFEFLKTSLNERKSNNMVERANELAEKAPVLADVYAVGTNLASVKSIPEDLYNLWEGKPIDINSENHDYAKVTQAIRSNVGNQLGNSEALGGVFKTKVFDSTLGEILHGAATSTVDMAVDIALGGSLGLNEAATGKLVQSIMSSQAMANGIIEAKERGLTDSQAVVSGAINGAVEWITEKYSIEAFLGDPKNTVAYIAKNIVSEGSEEAASDILNAVADLVLANDKSEIISSMRSYMADGMSEKEAFATVMKELGNEMGADFLAGAISGGTMGAVGKIKSNISNSVTRKLINESDVSGLLSLAKSVDENSDFYKFAENINNNKNVTNADLTVLKQKALEYFGLNNKKINIVSDDTEQKLKENGKSESDIKNISEIILKFYENQELTEHEAETLAKFKKENKADYDLIKAYLEKSVEYDSESQAEIKAYSEKYGSAAEAFVETYNLQPTENISDFSAAYDLAYEYGKTSGIDLEYALQNKELNNILSREQIEAAYNAGESETQLFDFQNALKNRKKNISSGVVELSQDIDYNSLNNKQKASIRALYPLSKLTGIKFEIFKSVADENGNYTAENGSYSDGVIRLDINAGKNSVYDGEVAILSTVAHELTHFLKENDREGYNDLQKYVIKHMGKDITELARERIYEYERLNKTLSFEEAVEEIVADSCTQMLKDTQALETLAKENKSLASKIFDFLKKLIADIKEAYKNVVINEEAKAMINYSEELQKLWDKAFVSAVHNFRGETSGKNIKQDNESTKYSLRRTQSVYDELGERKKLEKRNEKLKQDVADLKKLLSLQRKLTHGKIFKPNSIKSVAKTILREQESKYSVEELTKSINELYSWIATGENVNWESIYEKAMPIAENILDEAKEITEENDYYNDIKKAIQSTTFYLDDTQKSEVTYVYGSVNDFRKQNMGRFKISKTGLPLDIAWQELSSEYPNIFDKDITSPDIPLKLVEIYEYVSSATEYIVAYDKNERLSAIINDIYDKYWTASTLVTAYDVKQKEITNLKVKHNAKIKEIKALEQSKAARTKAYYDEKLANVIKNKNQKILETKKHGQEMLTKQRERLAKNAEIKKIYNRLNDFSIKLSHPTTSKHIPSQMKEAVARLCETFNYNTSAGEKIQARINEFRTYYSDMELQSNIYDENISSMLKELSDMVGNKTLREMSLKDLQKVYKIIRAVSYQISESNKTVANNKRIFVDGLVSNIENEFKGKKEKQTPKIINKILKAGFQNLKPEYIIRLVGSDTLLNLYDNLRKSEDVWVMDIEEAKNVYTEAAKEFKYSPKQKDKPLKINTIDGQIKLTLEQRLFLYAASKRPSYYKHLTEGGIIFPENVTVSKEKENGKESIIKVNMPAKGYRLSEENIKTINESLTTEQKKFVDKLQKYMSNELAAKGNEVSKKLYDIELFTEKNYLPIITDKNFVAYNPQQGKDSMPKIKNSGFTKETNENANNPVVIDDFSNIFAKHANQMALYHSTVLPMEDFTKTFGYIKSNRSVRNMIQNIYGTAAVESIDNLIRDVNGGIKTDITDSFAKKMLSTFKKASVFANLSVAIQQPSAIVRAMALINPKYFVKTTISKRNIAEMKKYAPIAVLKEMGSFDPSISSSYSQYITNVEPESTTEKIKAFFKDPDYRNNAFSWLPQKMDEITWGHIWNAAKLETKYEHPELKPGTKEFLEATGKRFTEVITRTQVYDSVFSRSENMRSKDLYRQSVTAFMSEPITSLNMIFDSVVEAKRKGFKTKEGQATLASGVLSVMGAALFNTLLKSIILAARDDDEDKTYLEKYITAFSGELLDSINPITMVPTAKDLLSIVKGYDVERADLTMFSDLVEAVNSLESDSKSDYEKIKNIAGALGNFFGIPIKNVWRDIESVYNVFFKSAKEPSGKSLIELLKEGVYGEPTQKEMVEQYGKYIENGEYGKAERLITMQIDKKINKRKREHPEEDETERTKNVNSSIRSIFTSYYKEKYINGNNRQRANIQTILYRSGVYGNKKDVEEACENWLK